MDDKTQSPTPENQAPQVPVNPPQAEAPKQPEEAQNQNNSTGPKGIAWDQVLNDYCTADENGRYPSLRDLAEKYQVGESTVMERSTTENWVAKRSETIAKADQIVAETRAKQVTDANNQHLTKWRRLQNIANRLLNSFEERLNQYDKAIKDLVVETDPEKIKALKDWHNPGASELNIIANTLKTAIEGERIVLGLPIMVSKSDVSSDTKVELPPETVAEIDRLFELNKNDKPTDSNTNS